MLKAKGDLIANILTGVSITSLISNFDTILTTFILMTTLIINIKILYDKFKTKKNKV